MLNKELVLVGYSGHGIVVAEAAIISNMKLKYYAEKKELIINPFELEFLGYEGDELFEGWNENYEFILGIGDNSIRLKVANLIGSKNRKIQNVIHKSASIAQKVNLGEGNFIARNVSVNPLVTIGNYSILNTGCIVEHECVIANAVHVGPGAILAGNVNIGDRTFIGANAVIKQGVIIGKDVIIGAGSVVLQNVIDGKKIVGNPSREL